MHLAARDDEAPKMPPKVPKRARQPQERARSSPCHNLDSAISFARCAYRSALLSSTNDPPLTPRIVQFNLSYERLAINVVLHCQFGGHLIRSDDADCP